MSVYDILDAILVILFVIVAGVITAGIVVAAYVEGGYIAAVVGGIVTSLSLLTFAEWSG